MLFSVCFGLTGCQCDGGFPDLYYDDFQSSCGSLPCGWTLESGNAAIVTTFHSGAQGMLIANQAVVFSDLDDVDLTPEVMVQTLLRCDPGAVLEVALETRRDGAVDVKTGSVQASDTSQIPFPSVEIPLVSGETQQSIGTRIRLRSVGGGCTVDELHLLNPDAARCDG